MWAVSPGQEHRLKTQPWWYQPCPCSHQLYECELLRGRDEGSISRAAWWTWSRAVTDFPGSECVFLVLLSTYLTKMLIPYNFSHGKLFYS